MTARISLVAFVLTLSFVGCNDVDAWLDAAGETTTPPTASIPDSPTQPITLPGDSSPSAMPIPGTAMPPRGGRPHVRLGTFNIQTFGKTKAGKPHVMQRLARIVREFDVLAIQEIRSKDESLIPTFVTLINQLGESTDGRRYDFLIGPRLGRTSSKEQYAYIYDVARIQPSGGFIYTLPDKYEDFHREPFVARFQFIGQPPAGRTPWTFTLINIHTDPDEIGWELNRLDDAFLAVQRDGSGEDDYIMLGDFNASDSGLGELGRLRHITTAIRNTTTNTRRTKMYDNIVFDRTKTSEFTGQAGVFDFAAEFALTDKEALEISDHLPVWADFYPGEDNGSILAGDEVLP